MSNIDENELVDKESVCSKDEGDKNIIEVDMSDADMDMGDDMDIDMNDDIDDDMYLTDKECDSKYLHILTLIDR